MLKTIQFSLQFPTGFDFSLLVDGFELPVLAGDGVWPFATYIATPGIFRVSFLTPFVDATYSAVYTATTGGVAQTVSLVVPLATTQRAHDIDVYIGGGDLNVYTLTGRVAD